MNLLPLFTFRVSLWSIVLFSVLTGCNGTPVPPATAGPTKTLEPVRLENQRTETVFLETVEIPLENCNGSSAVSVDTMRSRTTTTTIELKTSISLESDIFTAIKARISLDVGVTENEQRSFSQNVKVEVQPAKRVNYRLTWNETWQVGDAVVGNNLRVPYRVRTGLQPQLGSGTPEVCPNGNPNSLPPSSTPISTGSLAGTTTVSTKPAVIQTVAPTEILMVTSTTTPVPLNATLPQASPPTSTAPSVVRSYPCGAQIVSRSSSVLDVVRANPSKNAPARNPIQQGMKVTILAEVRDTITSRWYQIADSSGTWLGWVPSDYVIPSGFCPD